MCSSHLSLSPLYTADWIYHHDSQLKIPSTSTTTIKNRGIFHFRYFDLIHEIRGSINSSTCTFILQYYHFTGSLIATTNTTKQLIPSHSKHHSMLNNFH
ncbi:hypothetical protein Fmac_000209 [Flemingia macrophylla]|uniref:Uncharacterized protein n=1 Tax=Flemingia macrophylla TaxID=520843 RepID=A0ABD1NDM5_9FABA